MSLRPMLHLLKQEIAKSTKNAVPNIGEAFITVLVTHLNDTIGEGYRKGGGGCPETTTHATVVRGPKGIITAYPDLDP